MQADFCRKPGRVAQLGNVPCLHFVRRANRDQRARLFQGHQGERSSAAHIGSSHCFHMRQIARRRKLAKDACSLVMKEMQKTRAIDHGGIGIAVAIQIDPGKAAQAGNPGKRMHGSKRSIAIVSQHYRRPLVGTKQDVHIPIGFDIDRPRAGVGGMQQCRRQLGLRGHIRKRRWALLTLKANAAFAGQHQIHFEVVIEVDRQDGLGLKRLVRGAARERKSRACGQPYGMAIGYSYYGSAQLRSARWLRSNSMSFPRLVAESRDC